MRLPIFQRSRKFGYIFWKKDNDKEMANLIGNKAVVTMWFEDSYIGDKRIDWKNRRISIGYKQTKRMPYSASNFEICFRTDGALKIICK